ncbi:unnamed protein product [Musa acuminata subsp. burmannicoides]
MSGSREETPLRLVGRRTDPVKRTSVTSLPQPLAPPAFTPPTQSPAVPALVPMLLEVLLMQDEEIGELGHTRDIVVFLYHHMQYLSGGEQASRNSDSNHGWWTMPKAAKACISICCCPSIKEALLPTLLKPSKVPTENSNNNLNHASLGGSSEDGTYPALQVTKVHTRKALIEFTLDYDYGGPNPRHDPRKGKPGRGL